ncbi:hypothetical protein ABZ707_07580 [Streptomyces sp. NPDC006923]|uniref:hypothetical protein n=1 Tax=Streptomyces sp. NPDC006923 TaxID=3155355 RepID=UPI0033CF27F4
MTTFLLLLLLAVALGITGMTLSGLSFLLVVAVIVLIADLVILGARWGRGRRVTR